MMVIMSIIEVMVRPASVSPRRVFFFAMVMGPGPGVYLVNPGADHEGPAPTLLGLPIVYAWAVIWFGVQAAVLVTAYFTLWSRNEEKE